MTWGLSAAMPGLSRWNRSSLVWKPPSVVVPVMELGSFAAICITSASSWRLASSMPSRRRCRMLVGKIERSLSATLLSLSFGMRRRPHDRERLLPLRPARIAGVQPPLERFQKQSRLLALLGMLDGGLGRHLVGNDLERAAGGLGQHLHHGGTV